MSDTARQKPFPKAVLIFIVIGVVCLGIIFALLATIGDDVPNELPPPAKAPRGNNSTQRIIRTGVPMRTYSKSWIANSRGRRMHPCEAGLPGRGIRPACIPIPRHVRRIQ